MSGTMKAADKEWVIVKFDTGNVHALAEHPAHEPHGTARQRLKIWRNYEGDVWGSTLYKVLDYYTGTHKDAMTHARRIDND